MATYGQEADIGYGCYLTFGGDQFSVISLDPIDIERDEVETTHSESADRYRERIPGLLDSKGSEFEINYDQADPPDHIHDAAGELRIYYPLKTGETNPAYHVIANAFCRSFKIGAPIDDRMTATISFSHSGKPVYVAAT